ncbi:hypothetical protein FHR99_000883 [Litorivivens lipolytica]|uniref:Pilus assembly protein E-set like domain-containing protein n=1 Tax=Litorivivens lipolytica TaxID=1524264 RepID=A0A7W4W4C3_9GAMM|nr:TcfC E-set like domain-containing protein [Litorivivens lipolytica]MBB3046647.1 hypothetical protein [Litorivivens lipolytica]
METAFVDVYYDGRLLDAILADFDHRTIHFASSEELVSTLPATTDPAVLSDLLAAPIPFRDPSDCHATTIASCFEGTESPLIVTYDPNLFAAVIYLAPRLLPMYQTETDHYLPPYTGGLSYLADFRSLYLHSDSDVAGSNTSYNLALDQVLSRGDQRFTAQLGITDDEYYAREMYFSADARRDRFVLGRYELPGNRLTPGAMVYGGGIHTTTDLRLDLDQNGATQFEYFLPQRGRVDIYRDGRLLSTRNYSAGNHRLDVSGLPIGAYDIEIRVVVDGVVVQQDRRFFTKSTTLPPVGENHFSADVGVLADPTRLHRVSDGEFARLGYGHRLNDPTYIDFTLLATHPWQALQTSYRWVWRNFTGVASVQQANDGYRASTLSASWYSDAGSFGLDWSRGQPGSVNELTQLRRFTTDSEEVGLRYGFYRAPWSLRANTRYLETDSNSGMVSSLSAGYSPNFGNSALQISGSLNYDEQEHFSATLDVAYRLFRENHAYWGRSSWRNYGTQRVRVAIGVDASSEPRGDIKRLDYSALVEQREEEAYLEGDVILDHSRFSHTSTVSAVEGDVSSRVYSGSLNTSLNATSRGVQIFGGSGVRSGVLVSLPATHRSEAIISINEGRHIPVISGSVQFVPLQPYEKYRIAVLSKSGSLLEYSGRVEDVVLYPGHVPVLEWIGVQTVSVFGQIRVHDLPEGESVTVTTSRGRDRIENGGYFAVDLASDSPRIRVEIEGEVHCEVAVDIDANSQGVIDMGAIGCYTLSL